MGEEDVTKCIAKYFQDSKVDKKNLERLMRYTEEFSSHHMQTQMVSKLYRIMQNSMTKENMKIVIKRYLHIINEILEKDDSLSEENKYKEAVSAEIVEQYLTILKQIFKYELTDLLVTMKVYRKRWAKRITDHAFEMMRSEAIRQFKFDLNKGFPDEMVNKIIKSYQLRHFTQSDMNRYMPATKAAQQPQKKKQRSKSSSSSMEKKTKKKPKLERPAQPPFQRIQRKRQVSDMMVPHSSFIPSNSFANGHLSTHQRMPIETFSSPHLYPPPYYQPQIVNSSLIGVQQYYQPNSQIYTHVPYPTSLPFANNLPYPSAPPANYSTGYPANQYYHSSGPAKKQNPFFNRMQQILQKLKNGKFHECKYCGLQLSTDEKYQQHMHDHFSEAQKQFEASHSRRDHARKSLMANFDNWINSAKFKQPENKLIVPIKGGTSQTDRCTVCQGALKVSWSSQIDSWVYEDAVRANINRQENNICHAECYQTIEQFQNGN